MKGSKGITLIALVITIIVMLILVAVSITMAVNGGLFTHAGKAASATNANIQAEQELANLAPGMSTDQLIAKYTTGQGGQGGGTTTPAMQVKHGSEDFADLTSIGSVYYGDIVSIAKGEGTEQFYVIGSKSASATKIATASEISGANTQIASGHTKLILLAMYNLKADGSEQDTTGANNTCAFSSTNYWSGVSGIAYPYTSGDNAGKYPDLNDETTYPLGSATSDVKTRLQAYSSSLGNLPTRLMTVEELVALGGSTSGFSSSSCPSFINNLRNYWLGSAYDSGRMWTEYGESGDLSRDNYGDGAGCGVRPVVEVSIS